MYEEDCLIELKLTQDNQHPLVVANFDNLYVFSDVIYNPVIKEDDIWVVNIYEPNVEFPFDTYGWGTYQKFKFYSPEINVLSGTYAYTLRFITKIPSVFGDSVFGDMFSFSEWYNDVSIEFHVGD